MSKYILALFAAAILTSCNSVFVWTFEDVFGLSCLAVVIIWAFVSVIKDCFPKKKKK
jgi:hypothetical protein